MVRCGGSGGHATLEEQQAATDEAAPRIEVDFAELGRVEDQTLPIPSLNAVDVGSESLSANLCPTKGLSEHLVETILAFVEALGRNVVILHSDQEPVMVQVLWAVQSRRVKRTLVRHGPKRQSSKSGQDREREPGDQRRLPCDVAVARRSRAGETGQRQRLCGLADTPRGVTNSQ